MGASGSKSNNGEGKTNRRMSPNEGSTSNNTVGSSPSAGPRRVRVPGIVSVVGIPETHSPIERIKIYAPHYLQILMEREQRKATGGAGRIGAEQIPRRHNAIRLIEESDEAHDALLALVSTPEALTDLLNQKIDQSSSSSTADVPLPPPSSSANATSVISDKTARIILQPTHHSHYGQHSHGTQADVSKKGTSSSTTTSRHEHQSHKNRDKTSAHAPNSSEGRGGDNNSGSMRVSVGSSVDPQQEWYLLFSTKYHGRSFNQLVGAICQRGPTVVVIEASPEEKEHESEEEYRKRCHTVTVPKGDGQSGKTPLPYWREELKRRVMMSGGEGCEQNNDYNNNYAYSSSPQTSEGKETVPSRVFIGGYNTCNWLNAAQKERLAKREAAAAARGGGGGGGSASPHPYATGALSFLNETTTNGNISSPTDPTGSTDPASIAGIFSPTTNPAYEPSVPYGMRQGSLFSGNSNCWAFRADTFQVADDTSQPSPASTAATARSLADHAKSRESSASPSSSASSVPLRADRNYGYYNGRGDYSENLSQLRVFRPNTSRSSSPPSEATNRRSATAAGAERKAAPCDANYQYLVEKHPVDANKVGVGMGGDVDEWAWFLDKWLSAGSCNKTSNYSGGNNGGYGGDDDDGDAFRLRRCPTFNTLLLAPWQRWRIESVEVFAVDPSAVDHYKAVDCLHAEGARRADDGSGGAAAAAILASARERKRREELGLSQSTDSLPEESESAPTRNKERRHSDAERKAGGSHVGGSKDGPLRPLFITPVVTTTTGEFLSNIIGSAYGDCTEALKAHFNEVCLRATKRQYGGSGASGGHPHQRGPREGVLHGDGAACDKFILELNNNNEFRDDVVEDDRFDRVAGC